MVWECNFPRTCWQNRSDKTLTVPWNHLSLRVGKFRDNEYWITVFNKGPFDVKATVRVEIKSGRVLDWGEVEEISGVRGKWEIKEVKVGEEHVQTIMKFAPGHLDVDITLESDVPICPETRNWDTIWT